MYKENIQISLTKSGELQMHKKVFGALLMTTLICSFNYLPSKIDTNMAPLNQKDNETSFDTGRSKCKKERYDYIIVGLGTAGSVIARKLSDPVGHDHSSSHSRARNGYKNSVLVLEAGQNYDNDPLVLNPDSGPGTPIANILNAAPYSFVFPLLLNGNPSAFNATAGKAWGGTSIHNFMNVVRGTPYIYNTWAKLSGDKRWAYNNLLPTIKAVETYTPLGTVANYAQRGNNGNTSTIQISPPVNTDPLIFNIATVGATAVGLPLDYNDPTQGTLGFSASQRFNTPYPNRRRSFSSKDYIESVVTPAGDGLDGRKLKIRSGYFVSRVIFKGRKAVGVEYIAENNPGTVLRAYGRKIIISAGALQSPGILERSGIGDPAILNPLGIKVLVNNPNVGNNLQDHYGFQARMSGPLSTVQVPSGSFANGFTDLRGMGYPADNIRRVQMVPVNVGANIIQFTGIMLNPKSRGYVHIVSTNPIVPPKISLGFYSDGPVTQFDSDANVIVTYLKLIKQYADQNGRTMIVPTPATYAAGDQALLNVAAATPNLQSHYVGTTRMAKRKSHGVVDGRLRVFGVKNLMVADIGIEPLVTDGNTSYGAYVIGMEAAHILGVPVTSQ
jgi:choline dehydrogenase